MIRTRVGYTGGTTAHPTYHRLGDHSEAIQVDFNPGRISYNRLLDVFFEGHDPVRPSWSRQYRSAIFYHDPQQKLLAEQAMRQWSARFGTQVATALEPAGAFTRAEDYHQKYYLKQQPDLAGLLPEIFETEAALTDSTLAARLNGLLGGHKDRELILFELNKGDFSPELSDKLKRAAGL